MVLGGRKGRGREGKGGEEERKEVEVEERNGEMSLREICKSKDQLEQRSRGKERGKYVSVIFFTFSFIRSCIRLLCSSLVRSFLHL